MRPRSFALSSSMGRLVSVVVGSAAGGDGRHESFATAEVEVDGDILVSAIGGEHLGDERRAARIHFERDEAARFEPARGIAGKRPIWVETIGSAVQRDRRLPVANSRRQRAHLAYGNVGRIRDDRSGAKSGE